MSTNAILSGYILLLSGMAVNAFTAPPRPIVTTAGSIDGRWPVSRTMCGPSFTSLNVWWFGGTPGASSETSTSGEECELVAVRIDKTSPNSRRIAGEIVVPVPLDDVWAILTDYDDLSKHVPNLVASRRTSNKGGYPGDGSHQCRLYQRGAQKIVGFEFGADVTMDMTERIVISSGGKKKQKNMSIEEMGLFFPEERRIEFKCIDSQFFSEFDGTWRVVEMPDNPFTGASETTVSYTVEVRPKGPVPVAALEWRIREDVPTNLRAVKKAAVEVGMEGVFAKKNGGRIERAFAKLTSAAQDVSSTLTSGYADFILDYENETLGAYMD